MILLRSRTHRPKEKEEERERKAKREEREERGAIDFEVDVGVKDRSHKVDDGRLKGIIGGDLDVQLKESVAVGSVRRSSHERCPSEKVRFAFGKEGDIRVGRFRLKSFQLTVQPLCCLFVKRQKD